MSMESGSILLVKLNGDLKNVYFVKDKEKGLYFKFNPTTKSVISGESCNISLCNIEYVYRPENYDIKSFYLKLMDRIANFKDEGIPCYYNISSKNLNRVIQGIINELDELEVDVKKIREKISQSNNDFTIEEMILVDKIRKDEELSEQIILNHVKEYNKENKKDYYTPVSLIPPNKGPGEIYVACSKDEKKFLYYKQDEDEDIILRTFSDGKIVELDIKSPPIFMSKVIEVYHISMDIENIYRRLMWILIISNSAKSGNEGYYLFDIDLKRISDVLQKIK